VLIATLERLLGVTAKTVAKPKPAADLPTTFADVGRLQALTGYTPSVGLDEGLRRFVDWYRDYHPGKV
jgi:UDP-glucuronate 4-epimerase